MKAVLVMDMPSACKECPLRVSIDESICVKTLKDITDKEYFEEKPDWCPLKPMPSKIGVEEALKMPRSGCIADVVNLYNACIDEILGKE